MNLQLSNLLAKGTGLLILLAIIGGFVYGMVCLVRLLVRLKKLNHPEVIKYYFLMILCILVMIPSWILNIGWYRFILTLLAFPVIHSVLFAIINGKAILKLFLSKKIKIYTLLSFATYIISYISFPDGGDHGPMYVFFGLLHNNTIAKIAGALCVISFIAHIIVLILQLCEISKIKQNENSTTQ